MTERGLFGGPVGVSCGGHCQLFAFHSEGDEKPLEGFEYKSGVTGFTF